MLLCGSFAVFSHTGGDRSVHETNSRPDLSYFFANPDKIGNKLIFADFDSRYVLKYIWRVPHLEVRGK